MSKISEVIISVCYLPFLWVDQDIMSEKMVTEKIREVAYSNPEYKAIIKNQLPYFLTKGFLN